MDWAPVVPSTGWSVWHTVLLTLVCSDRPSSIYTGQWAGWWMPSQSVLNLTSHWYLHPNTDWVPNSSTGFTKYQLSHRCLFCRQGEDCNHILFYSQWSVHVIFTPILSFAPSGIFFEGSSRLVICWYWRYIFKKISNFSGWTSNNIITRFDWNYFFIFFAQYHYPFWLPHDSVSVFKIQQNNHFLFFLNCSIFVKVIKS